MVDSDDPDDGPTEGRSVPEPPLGRRLRQLYSARNRWRTELTKLTIEHMLEDNQRRCTRCGVVAPCATKKDLVVTLVSSSGVVRRGMAGMRDRSFDIGHQSAQKGRIGNHVFAPAALPR